MKLAIASGKGGTGKTTVATNLAWVAGQGIWLLDCDVEEPNVHLFMDGRLQIEPEVVSLLIPEVDAARCDGCGECAKFCEFKALAVLEKQVLVFSELCHGCGGCARVCPQNAIHEVPKRIGTVETREQNGITLVQGRMDVGVAMAPPLVNAVKQRIPQDVTAVIDAPPGTSCPVVATLRDVDYVVLVTEPTPFGLHDLKLAVEVVRELQKAFGVVINRAGIGNEQVAEFCRQEAIPMLAELPDDRAIAETYSRGELVVEKLPVYQKVFKDLWHKLMNF